MKQTEKIKQAMRRKMAMLHRRQAPGRDIHKHFNLAPARSHTITANSKASATRQTEQQQQQTTAKQ
jgi:hypothetical protein